MGFVFLSNSLFSFSIFVFFFHLCFSFSLRQWCILSLGMFDFRFSAEKKNIHLSNTCYIGHIPGLFVQSTHLSIIILHFYRQRLIMANHSFSLWNVENKSFTRIYIQTKWVHDTDRLTDWISLAKIKENIFSGRLANRDKVNFIYSKKRKNKKHKFLSHQNSCIIKVPKARTISK